jgi:hypothetical protein
MRVGDLGGVRVAGDALDHIGTAAPWIATTVPWLAARFAGQSAPEDCGQIPPGNVVAPIG